MTDPKTTDPLTSGGEPMPPSEEQETGRETTWVVLNCTVSDGDDPGPVAWVEREGRITAATRREAEKDALTISTDDAIVAVVPLSSWKPVRAERPTEFRIVAADPWRDGLGV